MTTPEEKLYLAGGYCGCCGERNKDCLCPAGPTLSFAECLRRWKANACANVHILETPLDWEHIVASEESA